jgi:hypothetical protein
MSCEIMQTPALSRSGQVVEQQKMVKQKKLNSSRVESWSKCDSYESKKERKEAKSFLMRNLEVSYSRKRPPGALYPSLGPVEKKKLARETYSHQKRTKVRSVSDDNDDSYQQEPIVKCGLGAASTAAGDLVAYFAEREYLKEMKELAKKDMPPSNDDGDNVKEYKKYSKAVAASKVNKPNKHETKWFANLEELRKYKQLNGDCMVPRVYPPNPGLGYWVR